MTPKRPDAEWRALGYRRNRYAKYRRMPVKEMRPGALVDCVHEGRHEWLGCSPVMAFIGHAVITHWRYTDLEAAEAARAALALRAMG